MYVPFFRCESFPYISRRADWLPCALFPFHSLCTPLVFISVLFTSLSIPLCFPFISRCFPVMSTSYFLPSFPCTSLHFLFAPQYFPQNARFFQRLRKEDVQKHSVFADVRQKEAANLNQQRAGRGFEPGTPLWPRIKRRVGGGLGGGVILYPLLGVRHAEQCRRIVQALRMNSQFGRVRAFDTQPNQTHKRPGASTCSYSQFLAAFKKA